MRSPAVTLALVFFTCMAHADVVYTFANTGTSPYTFSFTEPNVITTAGSFTITPFTVDGFTFTQAAVGTAANYCFVFGTAGANPVSGDSTGCAITALPGEAGLFAQFVVPLPTSVGTFSGSSTGIGGIPPAQGPNQLTISDAVPEPVSSVCLGLILLLIVVATKRKNLPPHRSSAH